MLRARQVQWYCITDKTANRLGRGIVVVQMVAVPTIEVKYQTRNRLFEAVSLVFLNLANQFHGWAYATIQPI